MLKNHNKASMLQKINNEQMAWERMINFYGRKKNAC